MSTLLERFLRYVQIDTQSDETSSTSPSTAKQLVLSRMLADECRAMGLADVSCDERGIVMATVPSNVPHDAPMIVWNSHVDTSPEYSGTNVKPIVHRNYAGGDLVLPGDPTKILTVAENPSLKKLIGGTIITTDGTTLLGSDDKAGVAEIMSAAAHLMAHSEIPHGPVRVCFTVDEEIGRGIEGLDFQKLGGVCGYTLDSGGMGRIDYETFSADLAIVTVHGRNTHPSVGKGVLVNAIRLLSQFLDRLPREVLSPESTDGRDGFLHPYHIEGGVAQASARIILRDFETEKLKDHANLLSGIAAELMKQEPRCRIDVEIRRQYRNMRDGLQKEPRALAKAIEAVRRTGQEPRLDIIRGGTDGALMTEAGLPTPNLSSGQHNPHSPLEWTSLEEMQKAVDVLVQLAIAWAE
ncbi:peptidase T [Planctomyces sp. SH-PL14]|uniref:peptidase T n=1 Tax=Planctomyces sp. SH-PL14 TaxID=1632864 RepID=UPI00078E5771|nr:peptidase T [Planctomyces sp. SH-PL14]AMV21354.1 Peptidase T [Planctomyces sp. SH-PL14]